MRGPLNFFYLVGGPWVSKNGEPLEKDTAVDISCDL